MIDIMVGNLRVVSEHLEATESQARQLGDVFQTQWLEVVSETDPIFVGMTHPDGTTVEYKIQLTRLN